MGDQEKQPFKTEIGTPKEPHSTKWESNDDAATVRPGSNWEGYSLEILSVWFDP